MSKWTETCQILNIIDVEYESSNAAYQEKLRSVSDKLSILFTKIISYYVTMGWHTKILKNNIRIIGDDGLGIN